MMKKGYWSILLIILVQTRLMTGADLIIRCDDIGSNHSVNMAIQELLETGLPINCAVMFPCGG